MLFMSYKCSVFLIIILLGQRLTAQNHLLNETTYRANTSLIECKEKCKSNQMKILGNFFEIDVKEPRKMLCITGSANTNGWSVGISYGKQKSEKITYLYTFSMSEIKHDKEEKIKPNTYEIQGYGKPRPYIYGKQNTFYPINFGYSQQRLLLKGFITPDVNISLVYGVDLSFGLLKPYYLKINHSSNIGTKIIDEKYSISNADTFLENSKIYSRSSFRYGLSEIKIIPGVQLLLATQIDFRPTSIWLKNIQFGISNSIYFSPIASLVDARHKINFLNLFVKLSAGKRW